DRNAASARHDCGGAGRRAKIDRAAPQELQRLVGSEAEHPTQPYSLLPELSFHLLEEQADRVVVGIIDGQSQLVGSTHRTGVSERSGDHCQREKLSPVHTAMPLGSVSLAASLAAEVSVLRH